MAKPLRQPTPTSAVARLFDVGAAARAISATPSTVSSPPSPEISPKPTTPPAEPANLKRELILSQSAENTFTELVSLYQRATGTKLTASHVARAVLTGVGHCMDSLEREAKYIGRLKLPSNARGREADRQRFEQQIAMAFIAGIRGAPALSRE
jgi:hypothetical protein